MSGLTCLAIGCLLRRTARHCWGPLIFSRHSAPSLCTSCRSARFFIIGAATAWRSAMPQPLHFSHVTIVAACGESLCIRQTPCPRFSLVFNRLMLTCKTAATLHLELEPTTLHLASMHLTVYACPSATALVCDFPVALEPHPSKEPCTGPGILKLLRTFTVRTDFSQDPSHAFLSPLLNRIFPGVAALAHRALALEAPPGPSQGPSGVAALRREPLAIEAPPGPPQGAMPSVMTAVMHS